MTSQDIVQKLWNLCDILRDDGINYSDYVTELVMLLFIKMIHESTESGSLKEHSLPEGCRWTDLNNKSGLELLDNYKEILNTLASGQKIIIDPDTKEEKVIEVHSDNLIKSIYSEAQTRIREPRHLEQIIKRFDEIKDWFSNKTDGLGNVYEGLLDKNANETKSGAGQYFTPRALINCIIECIKPQPYELIQDPAAGTGGFLVAAHEYIKANAKISRESEEFQRKKAYIGIELVPNTRRLALMNCLLHGIEGEEEGAIILGNTLSPLGKQLKSSDVILANPPFGTSKGGDASIIRDDLPYKTNNKQLAFLQHIYLNLKSGGRAAVIVPDNVLFETGVATEIRTDLMNKCNLHTILRLPTGLFYAQGVKTNVIFFTKGTSKNIFQDQECTENIWFYDLRTNMPSFGKRTPFTEKYLEDFKNLYGDDPNDISQRHKVNSLKSNKDSTKEDNLDTNRWRCFDREWIKNIKNDSLDIFWLKDKESIDTSGLPDPLTLANQAKFDLQIALDNLEQLLLELGEKLDDK
ncbi:class I SAM-dependent DNA methyltransferase [Acinetobacter pittii]|uniref:class I SAM-dependent DNA methyltransferase n=1 Tax=Acinetobacter pittii TaxID=48296 RepID=UPI0010239BDA|nr:N-6 DNA methylase [Acinetobacter pittii]MDQ8856914.1 N-6 DNA methylase [Acinetobacter pittii]MDQ8871683.1 N-6 DNA methylase [Acinetobacter pittii]RZH05248.1 SAM-dependent methyltransferase [Acinetobacter pittii]